MGKRTTSGRSSNLRSSIYQSESDGRWHGWVTMGVKDDGSPDRRHRSGKTETEVTNKVRELERKRDAGTPDKPGKALTVAAWMTTWVTTIAPRSVDRSTIDSTYRPKVERWIIPRLGQHRLDRLQPEHVDAFYLWLADQGLAPNTILQIHRILSRALKVAVVRGKVARNVCSLVDAPSGVDVEVDPLDEDEARRVVAAVENRRNGARWSVGLALGLRQCEALGIRWQYLNLETGELNASWQIHRQRYRHGCKNPHKCGATYHRFEACPSPCQQHPKRCPVPCRKDCTAHARSCPERKDGGWVFKKRKGGKDLNLQLPKPLVKRLKQHKAQQNEEKLRAGDAWEDWGLVFCQPNGRPIETHVDWDEWRDILAGLGIDHRRVHDARHTAGSLLHAQGADVATIQEILGHSSITMARRYTKVASKTAARSTARVGKALFG